MSRQSGPSGRKLNALEQRLHQTALADPNNIITLQDISLLAPDAATRTAALNFLLGTGMFKAMKDAKAFRVVTRDELSVTKGMGGEEQMVLSHIKGAGNEGIWSKHLKAKTDLHQTVIDRILKNLVQRQLIKTVKNVKFPTRKIYMMFDLDPSVELTGGPWYTDNELDTEFIKLLCSACLRFIRDRSLPKPKSSTSASASQQALYPISNAPDYPTAVQIQQFLSKSKITETQLDVDHVEVLLKVLILDGEIERIPSFGAAIWEANAATAEDEDSDRDRRRRRSSKKRRYDSDSGMDSDSHRSRKKKKHSKKDVDSSNLEESDGDDERPSKSRSKSRKRDRDTDDNESDRERRKDRKRKTKRRRRQDSDGSGSDSGSSDEDGKRSRSRSKSSSKSRRRSLSDSDSSSSETDRKHPHSKKRSPSPTPDNPMAMFDAEFASMHVYRAIKQERLSLGWSQAPCGRCPQFDFCRDSGPVNAKGCEYFSEWLGAPTVKVE